MKREDGETPELWRISQLLQISVHEHELVVSSYLEKQKVLQDEMKHSHDIKERIKLQNILLELDDAFLEYQSSIYRNKH